MTLSNQCILNSNYERLTVMKKVYIVLAVLATAVLASCEMERSIDNVVFGENEIVFSIKGEAATKSVQNNAVKDGVKIELSSVEGGHKLFMEETIQNLNYSVPATKGTPAFTENVGVLYANDLSVYGDKGGFTTVSTYDSVDDATVNGGWRYSYKYSSDPWPTDGSAVGFYLNMPAEPTNVTINSRTGGQFSINYTSPTTAAAQQDILFAYRSIDKDTYQTDYKQNGIPVLFNHALTGVKFAIANYDATKKVAIKSVSFTGLVGTASCVITPAVENNYTDYPTTEYSSGTTAVVNWTLPSNADKTATYSSGSFGTPVDFAKKTTTEGTDGTTTSTGGQFTDKGDYPDSFADAGNLQNLNDGNASQTFWFIPQPMTSDVKLTIVYTFGSTTEQTWTIDFGSVLNGVTWKAGELRTYTIKLDEVNVKITDHVTVNGSASDGYSGSTKTAVKIMNTGNTDAFIRASIVGQWLDADDNPVFGFTDEINRLYLVESWYEDQFVSTATGKHGTFTGLPGYKGGANPLTEGGWVLCKDGYYYYQTVVEPGQNTGSDLFTKYQLNTRPGAVSVAGQVLSTSSMHFELEIATQAISAKKLDGTHYTWTEAWARALGSAPEIK